MLKRFLSCVIAACILMFTLPFFAMAESTSYKNYIKKNMVVQSNVEPFSVSVSDNTVICYNGARLLSGEKYNESGTVLYTEEESAFDLKIKIPFSGLYNISVEYYPVEGRGQDIRRAFYIDGNIPFIEAQSINFSRIWVDDGDIKQDVLGNDLYTNQIQAPEWTVEYLNDSNMFYNNPFAFYLSAGEHTLTFKGLEEPLVIKKLNFNGETFHSPYKETLKTYEDEGYIVVDNFSKTIQAETPDKKSSPSLSAVSDRSDPAVVPSDIYATKLNTIGGGRFSSGGMWVEYSIEAPQKGLYQLTFKAKQNNGKDQSAYRNIYINGKVPFSEALNFPFEYSAKYKNVLFGDSDGAYLVPLNEGENTIRIEAALGDISDFCSALQQSMQNLNDAYRKIVTITGTKPDASRDYSFDKKMPDVIELFKKEYETLNGISNDIKKTYGQNSSYTATIDTLVRQLEEMYKDHYEIAANVSSLNSNISSLGSTVESMKKTDLTLDYIVISSPDAKLSKAKAGFFKKLIFGIQNLLNSYIADYNSIGATTADDGIEVWMIGGREQAQVLKQVVDSDFTVKTNKGVGVRLVSAVTTLLQATLAGKGPDVALGIPQTDAMNFAFRGAAADISKLDGFNDIKDDYLESALGVLSYNGGVYALPQSMDFPVMFYRTDILKDLQLEPPETWEDVYAMLPVLTQNNMAFGLPVSDAVETPRESLISFGALLYQRGGKYYSDDLSEVTFSEELTINVMKDWAELYTSYGLPIQYNFVNRFAAGNMPVAIQNYTAYQTLILYAPHIADLWDWALIPGTADENGNIDHSVPLTITATVVLEKSDNKQVAWEFAKWWCSETTQSEFGIFIENLLGKAGRYNTANIKAIENIPWSNKQYSIIKKQMDYTVCIPEIPGGYYTGRYLNNAFREIYSNSTTDGTDAREIMNEYDRIIDTELEYQRRALKLAS